MKTLAAILTAIMVAASLAASQALADITTRAVTFENEGATLSGMLYLPATAPGKPLPVVVVTSAAADTATAEADFTATHRIGDALWVLGGRYSYRLSRSGESRKSDLSGPPGGRQPSSSGTRRR